jgi:hypothetical protein
MARREPGLRTEAEARLAVIVRIWHALLEGLPFFESIGVSPRRPIALHRLVWSEGLLLLKATCGWS